jgi:hypothetical protein
LWIHQTRKESPKIIKNQLDPKNLCDIETLPSFNVRGSISVAKDILLEYSIGDESFDKKLEFKFIESDNRGFVIYKLEYDGHTLSPKPYNDYAKRHQMEEIKRLKELSGERFVLDI